MLPSFAGELETMVSTINETLLQKYLTKEDVEKAFNTMPIRVQGRTRPSGDSGKRILESVSWIGKLDGKDIVW